MFNAFMKVALLGRPNVGKSTLFNRLIRSNRAITHDRPGVTRDRMEGIVQSKKGENFTLIDTGGVTLESESRVTQGPAELHGFEEALLIQAQEAVDEAALLCFVVDGRDGLTPFDSHLADFLRKQNKPLLLVVNKVDGPEKAELLMAEFHQLGFDMIPVSASHGYNVRELEKEIGKRLGKIAREQGGGLTEKEEPVLPEHMQGATKRQKKRLLAELAAEQQALEAQQESPSSQGPMGENQPEERPSEKEQIPPLQTDETQATHAAAPGSQDSSSQAGSGSQEKISPSQDVNEALLSGIPPSHDVQGRATENDGTWGQPFVSHTVSPDSSFSGKSPGESPGDYTDECLTRPFAKGAEKSGTKDLRDIDEAAVLEGKELAGKSLDGEDEDSGEDEGHTLPFYTADGPLRLALLGRPNVGKSSLVNAMVGEQRMIVSDIAGTTRDSVDVAVEVNGEPCVFVDTAGVRRRSKIVDTVERYSVNSSLKSTTKAHVTLLVLDVNEGLTAQDKRLVELLNERKTPFMVLVNKMDMLPGDERQQLEKDIKGALAFCDHVPVLFISVLEKRNLKRIVPLAKKIRTECGTRVTTGQLNKAMTQVLDRHQPPIVKGARAKFFYLTQAESAPPTFVFFVNNAERVLPSYGRYVEKSLRKIFGIEYAPVRLHFRSSHTKKKRKK